MGVLASVLLITVIGIYLVGFSRAFAVRDMYSSTVV